ncbi:MAG: hypothetical protein IKJ05_06075, partial [Oscillospiraceae bacterium]|nr:hypothetical protein [Oscillospiraceae bacterium]
EKFGSVKCQELVGTTVQERVDGQWTCAEYVVWAADKIEELINKGNEMGPVSYEQAEEMQK